MLKNMNATPAVLVDALRWLVLLQSAALIGHADCATGHVRTRSAARCDGCTRRCFTISHVATQHFSERGAGDSDNEVVVPQNARCCLSGMKTGVAGTTRGEAAAAACVQVHTTARHSPCIPFQQAC